MGRRRSGEVLADSYSMQKKRARFSMHVAPWMHLKASTHTHTHTPQSPSDTHMHSDLSPAAVEAGGWQKGQQDEPERLRLKVVFQPWI